MDQNQLLMQSIRKAWGGTIAEACKNSSVPQAFLAALIGNESGGSNDAKRFEPGVLTSLWQVLQGRKAAYGSIGQQDLRVFIVPAEMVAEITPANFLAAFTSALQQLDGLASSWGLTQIMGYHALEFGVSLAALKNPPQHLTIATKMLAQFATRFQLDLATDYPPLFACWNTGGPDPSKTFDPKYCANGVTRMALYQEILANETDPGT